MTAVRLNKLLADIGAASRRGAERLLAEGRVTVNGAVITAPGAHADPAEDVVTLDGKPLTFERGGARKVYVMLNKPPGVVTTAHDPQGRPTVLDVVDYPERLFTVGRLDRDTEGLLLLTNDGDWAQRVAHPSGGVEKEYEAVVDGQPDAEALDRLRDGVVLPDGHVGRGIGVVLEWLDGGALVSLLLHEGHKRQARLMFGAIGFPVRRLVRVREGGLHLGDLETGTWRELTRDEIAVVAGDNRAPRDYLAPRSRGGARTTRRERDEARSQEGESGERPSDWRDERHPVDDRDRRPSGVGQIDRGARIGRGSGPAVSGHGDDVSGGDVAGPEPRRGSRR